MPDNIMYAQKKKYRRYHGQPNGMIPAAVTINDFRRAKILVSILLSTFNETIVRPDTGSSSFIMKSNSHKHIDTVDTVEVQINKTL